MPHRSAIDQVSWEAEMFRLLVDNVEDLAIYFVDLEGRVTGWSKGAERYLGYREDEVVGESYRRFFTLEDQRAGLPEMVLKQALGQGRANDRWHVRKDGSQFWGSGFTTPLRDAAGKLHGFAKLFRDRSELKEAEELRKRVERRRNARLVVTQALAEARSREEAAPRVLQAICQGLGWDVGVLWLLEAESVSLRCVELQSCTVPFAQFSSATRAAAFRADNSLPGRVWQLEKPIWIPDVSRDPDFVRKAEAAQAGLHGAFALPIRVGGRFLGVLEFFSTEIREPDDDLLEMMSTIGGQVGQFLERVAAEQALRQSEQRFRGLMEQAPFSVQVLSPEGRTLQVNRAFVELWGLTLESLADYNILHDPQLESQETGRLIRHAFAGEAVQLPTIPYDTKESFPDQKSRDDSLRWVAAVAYPLKNERGEVREVVLVHEDITARTRAEQALRASEIRLKVALEATRLGTWHLNLQTGVLTSSDTCKANFGIPPDAPMTYHTLFEIIHPEDRQGVRQNIEKSIAERTNYEAEYRIMWPDRSVRWIAAFGRPSYSETGTPLFIDGVTRDITDRRNAEEEVRRLDRQSRAILESITDAFFAVDRTWRFSYVNPQAERILDRKPGDLLGKNLWEEYPGLIGTEFESAYRRVMAERVSQSFTAYYPDHDRWHDVRAYSASEGVAVYFRDVTDTRRLERDLEIERQRLRVVIENVPVGIVLAEAPSGRMVLLNPQVGQILRQPILPSQSISDYSYWVAHHPDGRLVQPDEWTLARVVAGETIRGDEFLYQRGDGTQAWIRVGGAPIRDGQGRIIGGVVAFFDIDQEKKAEEAMRDADRRKDEFLATLAHELRNPLAPIRNAAQILIAKGPDTPELMWARNVIDRQVRQMAHLLDDLLDVSRITRNKLELRRERVSLKDVIDNAVETSQPLLSSGKHQLSIELPKEPVWLHADAVRLAQVFSNLLNNAAKYTPSGGRIDLRVEQDGSEAVVSIRDTGIGIDADTLPRIFEMFSQATPALERSQGGLGIGLSLVKGLVELHNGSVSARSEGVGRGSEFVVRLPLHSETTASDVDIRSGKSLGPATVRRILIADDNRDGAESLAAMLRLDGHEVQVAHDGIEVLEVGAQFAPDTAVLDIGMPRMNGYEAARRLRATPWGKTIRLIALTGWGQEEDQRRSMEAGFDAHLIKPVDPDALAKAIEMR